MIISNTRLPTRDEFFDLVKWTNEKLNEDAKERPDYYGKRDGRKLELDVKETMDSLSKRTVFEGTIELVSGQRFPDIIAKKYFGVEVKSSTQNHWITTGNSVLESTRVEGIEHIFLIFGKLTTPIEFKCRTYQECLSDVVVTHYPRYKIDMNLPIGATIFNKIGIDYDTLRAMENPINNIIKYYKNKLKDGETLWWIGNAEENIEESVPMKIRLWKTLSTDEKKFLIIKSMTYFTEIFGSSNRKYDRFTLWLVANQGVVSTSMRDSFSAGGKVEVVTRKNVYKDLPQVFERIQQYKQDIQFELMTATTQKMLHFFGADMDDNAMRIDFWIQKVSEQSIMGYEYTCRILNSIFERDG